MKVDEGALEGILTNTIRDHYERRARTLREFHPPGIQVDLTTGVANGVLDAHLRSRTSAQQRAH